MVSSAAGSLPKGNTASTEETLTHILYVDNEAGLLKAAKPILEMQSSFHVETASSVEEAMKKMENKTFDVIVCDYIMPGKDGLEFLKELRDSGNSIPFIIFTGKGREIVAIKALNLGADQYINKIGKTEAVYSELAQGIRTAVKGKKAEEALRDSEKEKSAVLDSMSELVVHQDLKHRILWANRKAADSVDMKAEQLKGRYCHKLWAESVNPCDGCPIEKTMKTGQPQQGENITPDGRVWSISGYPIKDANGNVTSVVEVVTNITEQKKAEEKLREFEKKYKTLVENSDQAILVYQDYSYKFANEKAEEISGYTKKELLSIKPLDLVHPEDLEMVSKIARKAEKTRRALGNIPQNFTFRFITKEGKVKWVNLRTIGIMWDDKPAALNLFTDITERRKVEEELFHEVDLMQTLFEHHPDLIYFKDKKARYQRVSKCFCDFLGLNEEDIIGKTALELFPEEVAKQSYSADLQVIKTGKPVFNREGSALGTWVLTTKIPWVDKKGNIIGVLGISRDITPLKKVEIALKESEEKFRRFFEKAPDYLYMISPEGKILDINKSALKALGYNKKEVVGKPLLSTVYSPSSQKRAKKLFMYWKNGGKIRNEEVNIITKSGETRTVLLSVDSIEDAEGRLVNSISIQKDITEIKKKEEEIANLARFPSENPNPVLRISKDGIVLFANAATQRILKREKTGIGKHAPDYVRQMVTDVFSSGLNKETEIQFGRRVFSLIFTPVPHSDYVNVYAQDITERKKAEEKRDEMMSELVTINEKLGVISKLTRHDARNKLSVVANNAYLAKQKLAANPDALEYLGDIESAVDQMEKIFDFSRNYEMLGIEDPSYMNAEKNVDEAAILFPELANVKLVNECKGLTVMADSLLRQLFYNLIDNTLRHGEKAGQIKVYYKEGKNQLKLIYEDDGVGIPEDEKEKIFMEGYGKGTGYGLYLIKKICEAYGWTIRETGKQGKGAQFTMTIPKTAKNGKKSYRIN